LVTRPGSAVIIAAPVYGQLNAFWTVLRGIWQSSKLPQVFTSWQFFERYELRTAEPTWKLIGLSQESGEAVEGVHGRPGAGVLLVLDEAKRFTEPTVRSLFQVLGGHDNARVLAISTPGRPSGPFHRFFLSSEWKTFTFSAQQIPRLREHYAQQLGELGPDDPFFKAQLEGEFADSDDGEAILSYDVVRKAVRPPIMQTEVDYWPGVLGFDPAGRGRDYSIACYRRGPNIHGIHVVGQGQDEMETCGRVVALAERLRVQQIIVDNVGLGGPMESRLREVFQDPTRRRVEVYGFNAGRVARDRERYQNVKTELTYQLRARFHAPDGDQITIPDDPVLIGQLCSYTQTVNSAGRVRVVDPSPSPDRADALLLALASDDVMRPSVATGSPDWL